MTKLAKILTSIMFALYLITLAYIIIFKANIHLLTSGGVPEFRNISFALYFNGKETLLNIAAFMPAGLFLMLLSASNKFKGKAIICFLISILFEVTQYLLMVGTSDLTDVITNTLGGILGILCYHIIQRVLKTKTKLILNWLCIPVTIAFCYIGFFVL